MDTVPMWMKNLDDEDMIFIKRFLLASGSLKEVAKLYGVTYPTVRVRLNKLIDKIKLSENKADNDELIQTDIVDDSQSPHTQESHTEFAIRMCRMMEEELKNKTYDEVVAEAKAYISDREYAGYEPDYEDADDEGNSIRNDRNR